MSISDGCPPFLLRTSAWLEEISRLITEELENMAQVEDPDQIWSKRKAINALFPYAVWREWGGDHRMVDAFLGIARAPNIGILVAEPIVTTLVDGASPGSPTRVMTLVSPYMRWVMPGFNKNTVTWWAAVAFAVLYTEEVDQSVVDALLQIASIDTLQPYIPVDIWAWLKKRPSLPPTCRGRWVGTMNYVVHRVRELRDVEILESVILVSCLVRVGCDIYEGILWTKLSTPLYISKLCG